MTVEVGTRHDPGLAATRPGSRRRLEALAFLVLAVVIWPVIAVGVVAGWGFLVWMLHLFTGPPGPA
ncbi:periplasmic nitrate reductase, NapE protein [Roseicella aquatilis]|uniref:periplasmic nitrate reductase, NapE protein n=1 Tax=Roseicella aquatilis TaxID=2527868 RepID=UPI00197FD637|nr:periplasmic nitrate reductase, NapE protein [Roseicella aquatilis]